MIKMKEDKSKRVIRGIKTVFFLITLLISFLFFSAPVLIALADTLLPSALLSASLNYHPNHPNVNNNNNNNVGFSNHFNEYDFRTSLIDIPLISILRSIVIICVYSCCDGPSLSSGPYLWVTTMCSVISLVFVSLKAPFVFGGASGRGCVNATEVALFVCSYVLAVGHVFVAYRTSCRERKKLLVYKIDIEAVSSACKKGLRYEQMLKEQRKK
ncbi:hypothetical protein vseg_002498 [Gypsophila vaccaria]